MTQWVAIAVAVAATIAALALWRACRRKDANLRLLLEALENADNSVRFRKNRKVNRVLNRIAEILAAERRRSEQADRYYGQILDEAGTGMMVVDSRGFVGSCNAAALRLLGLRVLTHTSQLARVDPSLPEAVNSAEPGRPLAVGSRVGLTLQVTGLKISDRDLRIFSLTDISRELEAREGEAWSQLARTLAHEIMNSLAPVISLSDTLLTLPPECEAERREGLEVIGTTGRSLMQFVESYRRVAQTPQPCLGPVEVEPLLRRVGALFPKMTWSCAPSMTVTADETMLSRVLINLCTNAEQSGAEHITVRAAGPTIDVANDGDPIPADIAADIFTPFFTTRREGSGIGLSLSRRMMTSFGGSLTLASAASPVTFRLRFMS